MTGKFIVRFFFIIFVFNFVTEGSYEKLYTPNPGVETVRERSYEKIYAIYEKVLWELHAI